MDDDVADRTLRVGPELSIPLDEIEVRYDTSGGPGGQHANRSQTRVELTFDAAVSPSLSAAQRRLILTRIGPIVGAAAGDSRSQRRNRQLALERLGEKLATALRVDPPRRPTRPTKASIRKRLDAKRQASERKSMRRRPDPD